MATKEEWDIARKTWCEDSRAGFGWLSESLGVSRQAVSKTAAKQRWEKVAQPDGLVAHIEQPQPVAQPKQPVKPKAAGKAKVILPAAGKPIQPAATKPAPSQKPADTDWQLVETRPRGRPTEYRDEYVELMMEFFDIRVEKSVDVEVFDKEGVARTEQQIVINEFPTITRFASSIGVTRETLHDWATAKNADGSLRRPDFSYSYARARDLQDALLVEGGMAGKYEGRFATLAAKNLIGWKDQVETKTEVNVTGATTDQLDQAYKEGMEKSARDKAAVIARNNQKALTVAFDEVGK